MRMPFTSANLLSILTSWAAPACAASHTIVAAAAAIHLAIELI
jgi:hypothetical protein